MEFYATSFFAVAFGRTTDAILNIKYDLYGYIEEGYQWLGIFGQYLIYITISMLYLNYFPYERNLLLKTLYIAGWTIFSIIFEKISLLTHFFYYHHWSLWISAFIYPILFVILVLNLLFVKWLIKLPYKNKA
ncbi:CBO0543 family protein [Heyndrickxia ginsengihumi]|uniref:CBO0543 family protein n=1 Tax=Heyndrickxia ginsengihumi TaxID=363870 RepID=UPI0035281037